MAPAGSAALRSLPPLVPDAAPPGPAEGRPEDKLREASRNPGVLSLNANLS